ncbi:MAG: hypothetical protein JSV18_02515 [Candidatus Bathyarchaeota archaeon]|nr:MAG: hypothetical protein JSV18_02515 [Candidatus Bathyarchaeota archaeon]
MESDALIKNLEKLMENLRISMEMSEVLSADSAELGGEWEQEVSTDLTEITHLIDGLIEDLSNIIGEAKSVRERTREDEEGNTEEDEELDKFEQNTSRKNCKRSGGGAGEGTCSRCSGEEFTDILPLL